MGLIWRGEDEVKMRLDRVVGSGYGELGEVVLIKIFGDLVLGFFVVSVSG